ncbi:VCBS domain-containing protein [Salinivibrio kushneri]|nr:VCBS domain-containing protein [Salinivibrio kushneri]WBA17510.1 VCBS domain-containing protein [Salinivibrio kushneri]
MKSISLSRNVNVESIQGNGVLRVNGTPMTVTEGTSFPSGTELVLPDNSEAVIVLSDGTLLAVEAQGEQPGAVLDGLPQDVQDEIAEIQQQILDGEGEITIQEDQATAAGGEATGSGSWSYVNVERDGSETIASAGFDTDSLATNNGAIGSDAEGGAGLAIDTTAPGIPGVTIVNDANNDGIIRGQELGDGIQVLIDLSGTGANPGDVLTINGQTSTITEPNIIDGTVTITLPDTPADGETLTVEATITDTSGNTSAPGSDQAEVDTSAEAGMVSVNDITNDDVINAQEAGETIPVTGSASGGDIAANDQVTMTINGTEYTTTVDENGEWSVDVAGSDLAADTEFEVVVSSSDEVGNTVDSATTSTHFVGPMATDDTATGLEDSGAIVIDVLANDIDPDGGTLTITNATVPAEQGTVDIVNGKLEFTPASNFNGEATLSYTVSDGVTTDTANATVTIEAVNDVAVITGSDSGSVKEDDTAQATGTLSVTDTDAGEAVFEAQTDAEGDYGKFSIDENGAWTYDLTNSNSDVQALGDGDSLTETFTVTTAGGDTETVTITINGTDDGAVITGSDSGSVKEDDTAQATGTLSVTDTDAGEAVFEAQTDAEGDYGKFSIDENGAWTYDLTNSNSDVQALGDGDSLTETFTVTTAGGDTETVTITINGTDDGAVITGSDSGSVKEDDTAQATGTLSVTDTDAGEAVFEAQTDAEGDYGKFSIDENGAWTYDLTNSNSDVQALGDGDSLTETFTVTTAGGDTETVTITINGTDDGAVITGSDSGSVKEDDTAQATGTLSVTDTDAGEAVFEAQTDAEGDYGKFSIDENGAWTYDLTNSNSDVQALGDGDSLTETFTVTTAGGDTETVTITINGTDDGAVITGSDSGSVKEDDTAQATGTLSVTDTDAGEAVFEAQTDAEGDYGKFSIDENGAWTYDLTNSNSDVQALGDGDSLTETFTVTTAGGDTETVTITINGTDDGAVITGSDSGSVKEDDTAQATGTLSVTDTDAGEAVFEAQTDAEGDYGKFSIDENGAWTYDLTNSNSDVQALGDGDSLTETFTVTTAGGDTETVTITINGTDDGAVITGSDSGSVKEDDTAQATGTLSVTDTDAGEAVFEAQTDAEGDYGKFSIDENGAWTYDLTNSNSDVQALGDGDSLTETFTVTTAGGDTETVTITINGTDDGAVITGSDSGSVKEDDTAQATGTLSVTDTDAGEAVFEAQTDAEGDYGKFSIDENGAWTYDLTNSNSDVQALGDGDSLTETFTVTTAGGDTETVTITINGTDDGAVITGSDSGSVKEDDTAQATGTLSVTDTDAGEAVFEAQTDAEGDYGKFSIDENGAWTYDLTNSNSDVQALGDGDSLTETFTVTTAGGDTETVTITINGTDDGAVITGSDSGSVKEDDTAQATGTLSVTDTDAGEAVFEAQTDAEGDYGKFSIDENGAWTYDLTNSNSDVQALGDGDSLTETFTVTTAGGDTETVTITINGTDDGAVITGSDSGSVKEDDTAQATGTLSVTDTDAGEAVFEAQTDAEGDYGKFSIDENGAWTYDLTNSNSDVQALGDGDSLTETFTVTTAGGDTETVTITINGTDDGAVITGSDSGSVKEDDTAQATGTLSVTDTDAGEAVFEAQTDAEGDYGKFSIDENGAWTYDLTNSNSDVQALGDGDSLTETFTVTTAGGDTETVTITINGTDDGAVITGSDSGSVKEDDTAQATGTLSVTDTDAGEAVFEAQTDAEGDYGKFSIDENGAWTYDLTNSNSDVQALGDGDSLTETFTVTTAGGDTETVTITINGTDDGAVITGSDSGSVKEDDTAQATGTLSVTDTDAGEAVFEAQTDAEGDYGKFSIDENGAWTYDLTNSNSDVQALGDGDSLTETFTVTTAGGDTETVTITINGTDDGAVITGSDSGSVKEDDTAQATGTLSVTDTDAGEAVFEAQTDAEGDYGKFSIDENGAWTYDLTNSNSDVQALGDGDSLTETFTVTTAGGDTETVTITINGTDDGAVITGSDSGSVKEDDTAQATGTLSVTDTDAGEAVFEAQTDAEGDYGKFSIDENGAWTYDLTNSNSDVQALGDGDSLTETFTVTTAGGDTETVTITINGTDDGAVITGSDSGSVKEDDTAQATGTLSVTDTDAGEAVFEAQTDAEGDYGKFSIDENGAWTYDLTNSNSDVQALGDGDSLTETFTVPQQVATQKP